jgi:hypothetical protein
MSNTCPPGVRRGVWLQSAADTSREKKRTKANNLQRLKGGREGVLVVRWLGL